MTTLKRTAGWTIARFRAWTTGVRGGRDRVRRYLRLVRLTNINLTRRGFTRHDIPRAAFI